MKKSISVVIPNYNGKHLLERNIPSVIKALEFSKVDYEIIIPDDASPDDSVFFLKEKHPSIIVIENKVNLGFSGNINTGLRAAKKKLVLALNSDVELAENYFEDQFKYFEDKNAFSVMGGIYDLDNRGKLIDAAKTCQQSLIGTINSTQNAVSTDNSPLPSFFSSGANALMDREKLHQINYFDEIYSPFYKEDADLGLKALRMGWKNFYEPQSHCYHKVSSTILSNNKKRRVRVISRRNKFLFHLIHLEVSRLVLYQLILIVEFLTRWISFDFSFYESFFGFINIYSRALKSRAFINSISSLKTKDVIKNYNQEISKKEIKLF